jgi:drug/metabolite transporter (DMT)-like permease
MASPDIAVTILALSAAATFGLSLVLTQLGLRELSPLRGACISVPTTALAFVLLSPWTIDLAAWNVTSAATFALAGLLFPAAVTILTFEANRRIGPTLTGALGNLTPLFAVLLAIALLGEAPRTGQIAGMAVILAGVLVLLGPPGRWLGVGLGLGIALPLAAALIRGLVQPVVKLGLEAWPNPFAATLFGYLVSAVIILTAGATIEGRQLARPHLRGWVLFSIIGLCNGLAMLLMYAALARGPIIVVAPLVACYPLATLVFGRILLGPGDLSRRIALGVAVTVAGVALLLVT